MSRFNFRRFREGPGIDSGSGSSGPSNEACIAASAIMRACIPPDIFAPSEAEPPTIYDRPKRDRPKTKRKQSAKQKKHTAAFARRMKACGKKWAAKSDAAKAKTDYRTFQAKFCKK